VTTSLLAQAARIEARVRGVVAERRADDPAPDDPFRGLYLSEEAVDRVLDRAGPGADRAAPDPGRLQALAAAATLSPLDVDLLLVAFLPDLDSRLEKLYGYLNDDVTRRRASVGLALEIAGGSTVLAADRRRLLPGAPLVERVLLVVDDADRPFLTRSLQVPDRVAWHLLGDDTVDPALLDVSAEVPAYDGPLAGTLRGALARGARLVHLREQRGGVAAALAVAALSGPRPAPLCLDLVRLAAHPDPDGLVALAERESLLRGVGIVAGPVEALADVRPTALRQLTRAPAPVALWGASTWDPLWSDAVPLLVDVPDLGFEDRAALWAERLGPAEEATGAPAAHFVLGPGQVQRAVLAARSAALLHGRRLSGDDLRLGARAQNAAGLERLARRVEPAVGWGDLVLPVAVQRQLREVTARARHRDRVLSDWRMRRGGGRGRGVTALFAGDSGTGKTMSAEVIAGDLGLDLYAVNLATVVDKYVGETEKNLERIFTEAGGVNAVLLFDEADAIFGKRSEVRDAHDRYANIESAYLLQRMETFDGLAVLATNLRANIDDAFTRRLDAVVDFVAPTAPLRQALWEQCLSPPLPRADDLDLAFLAEAFELSGGNIRSAATTAAYLAASGSGRVGMDHLVTAVQQEYRKLGRLVHEREFGRWLTAGA